MPRTSKRKSDAARENQKKAVAARVKNGNVECVCKNCGKQFNTPKSYIAKGGGKFCSNNCRYVFKRGDNGANAGGGAWMLGENNPNYIDGKSSERKEGRVRYAKELNQWRRRVYARDGYQCQECGIKPRKQGQLNAHHIKHWATHESLRFDINNGITVCIDCHKAIHARGN